MKQLLLAAGVCLWAGTATADGPGTPVMEPEVVVTETEKAARDDSWVVLLMTVVVFGAALSN